MYVFQQCRNVHAVVIRGEAICIFFTLGASGVIPSGEKTLLNSTQELPGTQNIDKIGAYKYVDSHTQ